MKLAFLTAFVLVTLGSIGLRLLNLRHQQKTGHVVPPELAGAIDAERLAKIAAYTRERTWLGVVSALVHGSVFALFLFAGWLGAYDASIQGLGLSFVAAGVLFLTLLAAAEAIAGIPAALYSNFVIEARYGFNRMSARLWWSDWLKGTLLSLLFTAIASAGALALVRAAPESWWLWVWALFVGLSVLLMYVSPYLIEPLFFKMEPLAIEGFEDEVRALAERAGVQVRSVLKVDASKRSAHSNAYFTGIGRVKRVVMFDTLLTQMSRGEILAVLAHELGHWKKRHVQTRLISSFAVALAGAYVVFHLIGSPALPALVGLEGASFPARALILGALGSVLLFPLTPLFSYWSRRHEWEADRFAVELYGQPRELASALVKLARENLSSLHPHPLYAAFYYSHPPMPERIRRLREAA